MYCVYIIYSASVDQYYVGHSENLEDRLYRHKHSGSAATKKASDWALKYTRYFETRSEAVQHEMLIKRKKSRKYLEWLIASTPNE